MTKINPEEEFAKRFKKPTYNQITYMTKTTFNDLLNKVDLVLKNQEVIINLLSVEDKSSPDDTKSVSRRVYKELVSGKKIQVGWVLAFSSILEFNVPKDVYIKTPNSYYPEWYIQEVTDNGYTYNLFKPSNDIIEIVDKSKNTYCVTGFLIEDGRAVYYDQYL